jgi:hypothetical protein
MRDRPAWKRHTGTITITITIIIVGGGMVTCTAAGGDRRRDC